MKILRELGKRLEKFLELHNNIYAQFSSYGLFDLHCQHNKREIVSRHFFNPFSGNIINAMWLHYGKSHEQLSQYPNGDESLNRPDSFINNIRMQVIIHEDSIGIWLVLGRNNGSRFDREYFRNQMKNIAFQNEFFDAFKKLGNQYWIDAVKALPNKDIKTSRDLYVETQKGNLDNYFIIGRNIDWLDKRLSVKNLSNTVLE